MLAMCVSPLKRLGAAHPTVSQLCRYSMAGLDLMHSPEGTCKAFMPMTISGLFEIGLSLGLASRQTLKSLSNVIV